jgi:hypothetical protein
MWVESGKKGHMERDLNRSPASHQKPSVSLSNALVLMIRHVALRDTKKYKPKKRKRKGLTNIQTSLWQNLYSFLILNR